MNVPELCLRLNAQLKTAYTQAEVEAALDRYQAVQAANDRQAVVNEFAPYKSSLLVRLLEGKAPFVHPVPRANSYPAYAWMEDEQGTPHRVAVFFQGDGAIVEQTRVTIQSRNPAAQAIDALMRGGFNAEAFLAACAEGPVWKVAYPFWPVFSLTIMRMPAGVGRRDWLERRIERASHGLAREDVLDGYWLPQLEDGKGSFSLFTAMAWSISRAAEDWADTPIRMTP